MIRNIYKKLLCFLLAISTLESNAQDTIPTSLSDTTAEKEKIKIYNNPSLFIPPIATNYTRVIEGLAPGIQTTNGGGQPGSASGLLIRGAGNLYGSSAPLIILDGAPYTGDVNAINPQDIATIKILKSATETMRYGGRAANGIVEIKTKNGKSKTKPSLSVEAKAGIVTKAIPGHKTIDNEKDYYEISWEAFRNTLVNNGNSYDEAAAIASGKIPGQGGIVDRLGYNSYNIPNDELLDPATGKLHPDATLRYSDGNWGKATERVALRHEYNAAFSGGGNKGTYYFSSGYLNEGGYIKNTGFERFIARFNGDLKPLHWLNMGVNISGAFGNKRQLTDESNSPYNPIHADKLLPVIYPVHYYNKDGEREIDPLTGSDKFDWGSKLLYYNSSMGTRPTYPGTNALGTITLDKLNNKSLNWTAIPFIEATLLKQFRFKTQIHYNHNKLDRNLTNNPYYGNYANQGGMEANRHSVFKTISFTQTLNWVRNFRSHNLDMLAGYEHFNYSAESEDNIIIGTGTPGNNNKKTYSNKLQSYFVIGNYNFKEKYFVTAGYRKDGSNMFITGQDQSDYWSFGGGWDISREPFLKNARWINKLKLVADYGKQGNLNGWQTDTGFPLLTRPNTTLNAEFTNHTNLGMEISLFDQRLQLSAGYYIREGKNLFLPLRLPGAPTSDSLINSVEIKNDGIEIQVQGKIIRNRNTEWTTVLNLTSNRNEITKMPDGMEAVRNGYNIWTKGNPVYNFKLPESAGVDPNNGDELYYYTDFMGQKGKTNDIMVAEVTESFKNSGSTLPKLYGSLINEFNYKNIGFSFMFTFGLGGQYYDAIYQNLIQGQMGRNLSSDILDRWTPENRSSDIPAIAFNDPNFSWPTTRFLYNASYLNWRNASLSYSFSKEKLEDLKLSSLKIYIAGDNLMLFTARKGMDPQATFNGSPGYNYSVARTIIIGLKVGL